jgi:quercetin dioxygenase-like cupin family protein
MSTRKAKLMLAGVLVACAFGGIALRLAWATPGAGITTTIVSGPVVLLDSKVKSESEINKVEIENEGFSDVYVVHNRIAVGGHTGWHSHPGPSIISVKSGQVIEEHADGSTHLHVAGTSFLEPANTVHIMRNPGPSELELVAVQILPLGAPRRIDAAAP